MGYSLLRLKSEDSFYDFISQGAKANREIVGFLELVRLEYQSTNVMNDFFSLHLEHLEEINAST
jgi:hypothetical protein